MRRRWRRALRNVTTLQIMAAGAIGLYAITATEPSLGGVWVREQTGTHLLVSHVGPHITGTFMDGTGLSFEATATGTRRFAGQVLISPIEGCGESFFEDSYRVIVSEDGRTIEEFWNGTFGDPATCEVWRTTYNNTTLRRLDPAERSD
jgi:hypothetical protein